MSSWGSYPSIYNLGHRAVKDLLSFPHLVEEKIDGSQFSFGLVADLNVQDGVDPFVLRVRSKGAEMIVDAPEKMFKKAVATVKSIQHLLHPGWTYRCEYLAKPKHNTLFYDRMPEGNLIGFDVSTGDNEWLDPIEKLREFRRLGLECVPLLARGGGDVAPITLEQLRTIIDTTPSVLGGQLVEGIVVKPFNCELFGPDKKTLMGKFVSERFKEAHKQAWKETSPNSGDILERLTKTYKVEGRWMKAIQHLRDAGALQDAPQDIPVLLNEIQKDLGQECKDEIKQMLWRWAWPHVARNITRDFPEYYKDVLLRRQFEIDEPHLLDHADMIAEGCPNHD